MVMGLDTSTPRTLAQYVGWTPGCGELHPGEFRVHTMKDCTMRIFTYEVWLEWCRAEWYRGSPVPKSLDLCAEWEMAFLRTWQELPKVEIEPPC